MALRGAVWQPGKGNQNFIPPDQYSLKTVILLREGLFFIKSLSFPTIFDVGIISCRMF